MRSELAIIAACLGGLLTLGIMMWLVLMWVVVPTLREIARNTRAARREGNEQ